MADDRYPLNGFVYYPMQTSWLGQPNLFTWHSHNKSGHSTMPTHSGSSLFWLSFWFYLSRTNLAYTSAAFLVNTFVLLICITFRPSVQCVSTDGHSWGSPKNLIWKTGDYLQTETLTLSITYLSLEPFAKWTPFHKQWIFLMRQSPQQIAVLSAEQQMWCKNRRVLSARTLAA